MVKAAPLSIPGIIAGTGDSHIRLAVSRVIACGTEDGGSHEILRRVLMVLLQLLSLQAAPAAKGRAANAGGGQVAMELQAKRMSRWAQLMPAGW